MSQDYLDKLIEKDKAGTQIQSIPLHDTELREITIDDPITVEGNPINFSTKNEQNAIQTVVDLNPIQDLHGYTKPWVGGAGKNLLEFLGDIRTGDNVFNIIKDTDNNILGAKLSSVPTQSTYLGNTVYLKAGSYRLSGCPLNGSTSTYSMTIRRDRIDGAYVGNADIGNGSDIEISSDGIYYITILVIANKGTSGLTFYPMLRLSTVTDDIFEPYTNICPILPHEEIKIGGCGKNLIPDGTDTNNGYINNSYLTADGSILSTGINYISEYFRIKANSQYVLFDKNHIANASSICFYDINKNYITGIAIEKITKQITTPENAIYARCTQFNDSISFIQFESGSIAHECEPYTESNNLSIDLPSTIYGGTLNLETGELVVDRVKLTNFDTANITEGVDGDSNWLNIWFGFSLDLGILGSNSLTERNIHIQKDRSNYSGLWNFANITNQIHYYNTSIRVAAFYPKSMFPTLASFIAYEVKNRAEFILALATPYTLQLTPSQLKLFKDVNNLNSSDYTTLTVTYHSNSIATLAPATDTTDGLLSAMDKHKLNTYDIADIGSDDGVTAEDNPLMITTHSDQHALSTKVSLAPIQDLHGYSKPWVGGAGKNLLKMTVQGIKAAYKPVSGTWSGNTFTSDNLKFILITDPDDNITAIKYEITGTLSEQKYIYLDTFSGLSGNYLLSGGVSQNIYVTLMINNSWSGKYSRDPSSDTELTISSSSDTIVAAISVGANISGSGYFYPMIRLATEPNPAFEPYTNICSISGLDEIDIFGYGKNIWNGELENGYIYNGNYYDSTSYKRSKNFIRVIAGETYRLTNITTDGQVPCYDKNKVYKNNIPIATNGQSYFIFTIPNNIEYIKFYNPNASFDNNVAILHPSDTETYEPYTQSNNLSISLPETVYGGELDLESGELVVDRKIADLGNFVWTYDSSRSVMSYGQIIDTTIGAGVNANFVNTVFERNDIAIASMPNNTSKITNGYLYVKTNLWTNASVFKTAMTGQKLVYELADSYKYTLHLTPSQLTLFKDINHISTNAKSISVTYREGKLAINSPATDTKDGLLTAMDKRALDRTEEIIKGNPIAFEAESAQVAKSTIVDLEPIQDLHGYSKPWVGGAGKNLLPMAVDGIKSANTSGTWSGNAYTLNNVVFTILTDSDNNVTGIHVNGTANATTVFRLMDTQTSPFTSNMIFNGCPSGGSVTSYYMYFYDQTSDASRFIDSGSGANVDYSTISGHTIRILICINSGTQVTNKVFYPMIRLSTVTDATFEPYTNIASIYGRSEVDILGHEKNLFDPYYNKVRVQGSFNDAGITYTYLGDGKIQLSNTATARSFGNFTFVTGIGTGQPCINLKNKQLILSCEGLINNVFICWSVFRSDGTYYGNLNYNLSITRQSVLFTMPNDAEALRFYIQVESGTALTTPIVISPMLRYYEIEDPTYSPYQQSTSLQIQLGETVYGGQLDVENGVLVVDRGIVDLGDLDYSLSSAESHVFRSDSIISLVEVPETDTEIPDAISSIYYAMGWKPLSVNDNGRFSLASKNDTSRVGRFVCVDHRYSTVEDFVAGVTGETLCYLLKNPITIQLTPEQVKLLQGVNTITTNADNITLTYRNGSVATLNDLESLYAKLKVYIDSLHSS